MKLRLKVISLVLGILVAAILFLSVPLYWYTRSALEAELDKQLLTVAELAGRNLNKDLLLTLLREPALSGVRGALEEDLSAFSVGTIEGIAVFTPEGLQLAKSAKSASDHGQVSVLLESLSGSEKGKGSVVSEIYQLSGGEYFKAAATAVNVAGNLSAVLIVWGGVEFVAAIDQMVGSIFWIILISLLVAISLATIFSRSLIRPVRQLSAYAQSIRNNIHTGSISLGRKDEFGELNRSLSEMHTEIRQHEQSTKQLLSGIAHEIKNPLGGMEIYTGLLEEELSKASNGRASDEHRSYLQKIRKELGNLKQIVLEYLDYARPVRSHLESLAVEAVIKDVHRILLPEIGQKNVNYSLSGKGVVLGDESKLRRVFVNLLKNSLEAVDKNGTIAVRIEDKGSAVRTEVSDDGKGIAEEDIENIFKPYFTTQDKGYGLGLTIAKNIIDEMNGTIIVQSEVGKGTRFTLELPKK